MDLELKDIVEFLHSAARSIARGGHFALALSASSAVMLTAAGMAYAAEAAIRSRVDMTSLAMRWPLPLRHFARRAGLQRLHRDIRDPGDRGAGRDVSLDLAEPRYMLMVAAKLALAWLMIRLVTSSSRNAFIVKLVSVSAWWSPR